MVTLFLIFTFVIFLLFMNLTKDDQSLSLKTQNKPGIVNVSNVQGIELTSLLTKPKNCDVETSCIYVNYSSDSTISTFISMQNLSCWSLKYLCCLSYQRFIFPLGTAATSGVRERKVSPSSFWKLKKGALT